MKKAWRVSSRAATRSRTAPESIAKRASRSYARVHVEGTQAVVNAARRAGVKRIALMSFLRARPDCGSGYHESKWQAEQIVRNSGLDFTILKAGVIYGRGDHLLDHLARSIMTIRLFALVGWSDAPVRPVAVEDVVRLFEAALAGRLSRQTLAVMGPESLPFSEAVRRVSKAVGRRVCVFPAPVWFHKALAWGLERAMTIPLDLAGAGTDAGRGNRRAAPRLRAASGRPGPAARVHHADRFAPVCRICARSAGRICAAARGGRCDSRTVRN